MPKAFSHGTVRTWKRGNVMKHGAAWTKLAKDKPAPLQPVPVVAASSMGGNAYGTAQAFTPEMNATLESISRRLDEKIQSPSSPKGRAAYTKSLTSWSKAASKVAQSYKDRLGDLRQVTDAEALRRDQLGKLLQTLSGQLAQAAELADSLKE